MYAIIENGAVVAYPINPQDYFPTTSFPVVITPACLPDGCVLVNATQPPSAGTNQKVQEVSPTLVDGAWTQTYQTVDLANTEIAALANALCSQVDFDRDAKIANGFMFDGYLYQSAQSDRENVMGAAMAAAADPTFTTNWITANNSIIAMNATVVQSLFQTGVTFKGELTFYARNLKDQIMASDDPQSVYNGASWPF